MTVSAATLGVAISAPVFGALTERLPRKRVIVFSLLGISIPTLLAATSTSLAQLIFWRFLQGIMVPGIVAVVVTYIGEEWPPERVALIMSFYVSGTALGGFAGRISAGILADHFSWRVKLPRSRHLRLSLVPQPWPSGSPHGRRRVAPPRLRALLSPIRFTPCSAAAASSPPSLSASTSSSPSSASSRGSPSISPLAPFSLSTTALSSLFFVYLIGLVVTPVAGYLITRVGLRAGIAGAICCAIAGVLLTLAPSLAVVILGLAMLSSGVFIAQTASQSHLRIAAPPGARVTAAGLYITCYYLGGTAAGVVPGAFWALGKWPACVAFIVAMQCIALAIALVGWRVPAPSQPITSAAS